MRSFDWVWSADCAGYPAGDLLPVLKEMMRVVKPEGSVNILGWTSQQVLPGYPLLEARLNAAYSSYLPYLTGKDPRQHFLRALDAFQDAGLENVRAQTFVGEAQAPLKPEQRAALASLFEMLWTKPASPQAAGIGRNCKGCAIPPRRTISWSSRATMRSSPILCFGGACREAKARITCKPTGRRLLRRAAPALRSGVLRDAPLAHRPRRGMT